MQQAMACSWVLFVMVLLPLRSRGSVISTGTLQSCDSYQDGLKNCGKKLIVEYSIAVGENTTDSIAASIGKITDRTTNQKGTLGNKQIYITFKKTAIYFYYPTYYEKTVNYQPWELKMYGLGTGSNYMPFNFNPLTPLRCKDGTQEDNPACGRVKHNGETITGSEGKCCACGVVETVFEQVNDKRGGLQCNIMSKKLQSAHCMRLDPLYYHLYTVGPMNYWYQIHVTVKSCPIIEGKTADEKSCTRHTLPALSPENSNRKVYNGKTPSESSVQAQLLGDLGAFATAPNFQAKYLAVPAGSSEADCTGPSDPSRSKLDLKARCVQHVKEGKEKWMLIDNNLVGDECNKIGVTYESFRYQSGFCDREFGSCTRHQLADYYDYDDKQAKANKIGKYWLSSMSHLGLIDFEVADQDNNGVNVNELKVSKKNVRLRFKSNRFQNTLIRLEIKAEDISLTTNVANGKILDWQILAFENGANDGVMTINFQNTDTRKVNAQFILGVIDCDRGITVSTDAGQAIRSLTGGQKTSVSFSVLSEYAIGSDHTNKHICTAQLYNAAGELIDSAKMNFKTFDTKVKGPYSCTDKDSSCADGGTGEASQGGSSGGVCHCGIFDFQCYTKDLPDLSVFHRCSAQLTTMIVTIIVIVVALIILCICCKVLGPKRTCQLLCLPFKCFAECCKCGMDMCFDRNSRENRYQRHDSYDGERERRKRERRKRKKKRSKKRRERSKSSSTESDSETESDSAEAVAPTADAASPRPPMGRSEIPMAVLANDDQQADAEEVYNYAHYFDNNTMTVFFNLEGGAQKEICNMEGQDFSIRGVLTGDNGTFIFSVPPEDRYVRKEMCNGELCELETPRVLHDQINEVTLTDFEVYWHITKEMRVVAINT